MKEKKKSNLQPKTSLLIIMDIFLLILKLCAGVGLFLFAMYLLEESLKNLSGRNFKIFLQRSTKNKLGAVAGGAIVTGVLQSSSMVSLMVLAFVGAGVFTMKSALAIILGANLGTTLDSWVVATLGFKTNIEVIAYPTIFIGGLLLIRHGGAGEKFRLHPILRNAFSNFSWYWIYYHFTSTIQFCYNGAYTNSSPYRRS
jgi:hypothetical protein